MDQRRETDLEQQSERDEDRGKRFCEPESNEQSIELKANAAAAAPIVVRNASNLKTAVPKPNTRAKKNRDQERAAESNTGDAELADSQPDRLHMIFLRAIAVLIDSCILVLPVLATVVVCAYLYSSLILHTSAPLFEPSAFLPPAASAAYAGWLWGWVMVTMLSFMISLTPFSALIFALTPNDQNFSALFCCCLGPLVLMSIYYASFESSRWRATPGKRLMGLTVGTSGDQGPTYTQCLIRFLFKSVTFANLGTGLITYFLPVHKCLQDIVARTDVRVGISDGTAVTGLTRSARFRVRLVSSAVAIVLALFVGEQLNEKFLGEQLTKLRIETLQNNPADGPELVKETAHLADIRYPRAKTQLERLAVMEPLISTARKVYGSNDRRYLAVLFSALNRTAYTLPKVELASHRRYVELNDEFITLLEAQPWGVELISADDFTAALSLPAPQDTKFTKVYLAEIECLSLWHSATALSDAHDYDGAASYLRKQIALLLKMFDRSNS
ncbi:MAG: RDD family protein, partial [Terriglobales bacterium]